VKNWPMEVPQKAFENEARRPPLAAQERVTRSGVTLPELKPLSTGSLGKNLNAFSRSIGLVYRAVGNDRGGRSWVDSAPIVASHRAPWLAVDPLMPRAVLIQHHAGSGRRSRPDEHPPQADHAGARQLLACSRCLAPPITRRPTPV
jgi:hypothetical protein